MPWDPAQYERFRTERSKPFFDLLEMVEPRPGMRVLDLGCGTGALTAALHGRLQAAATLGVERDANMLGKAARDVAGLRFALRDIEPLEELGDHDLVFSNAALQWLPDHLALMPRVTSLVAPAGQLAAQVPANHGHISHQAAQEIARRAPYRSALHGWVRESPVLEPERYAELLHGAGFVEQRVELRVYPHLLESSDAIVEWVRGTLLTAYLERLDEATGEAFVAEYRAKLRRQLGGGGPLFYPFKRILMWGRRGRTDASG